MNCQGGLKLSSTYKIKKGDTLDKIARQHYGSENNSDAILRANPDLGKQLPENTFIAIPELSNNPQVRNITVLSNNDNEVSLLIDGVRFRFWNSIRLDRAIDRVHTVEFTAPFDAGNRNFRQLLRPFSFQNVSVFVGGIVLFKGTMVAVKPELLDTGKTISVSCYSLAGVLNDCTPPASAYPLEYNQLGLRDIAQSLCTPFGISVVFLADQGAVFERVACDPTRKILDFLQELAKQRGLIIASGKNGELIFWRGVESGNAVASFVQGQSPLISVIPSFSPQEYYSHVTGIEPVVTGTEGSQYTVKNPRLNGVVRPLTFTAQDTIGGNIKSAVAAKSSRMFANMVSYEISVSSWRDKNGHLWQPNTNIYIQAPDAMIYEKYEFTIRSVSFEKDAEQETATLNVVIVGSFNSEIPEVLPWD